MTPTIEETERIALDSGAFVAIECVTYALKDGEIVFTKEQLQAFAQHWIEVGREKASVQALETCATEWLPNMKQCDNVTSMSQTIHNLAVDDCIRHTLSCAQHIRNNTGE